MDEIGWILLVIVAACVIALILITKKRRELEEEIYEEPEKEVVSVWREPEKKPPVSHTPPEEKGPRQITIYGYRSVNKSRLCPLCDGENDPAMTKCHICGQKLN